MSAAAPAPRRVPILGAQSPLARGFTLFVIFADSTLPSVPMTSSIVPAKFILSSIAFGRHSGINLEIGVGRTRPWSASE